MLLYSPKSGVTFHKDWDTSKISIAYWKGQPKYQSKNSFEVDQVLLDNLLQKCQDRVTFRINGG